MTDQLLHLLIIIAIGALAGLAFNRYARSWLSRFGLTAKSDVTSALVGIAGAFIGYGIAAAVVVGSGRVLAYGAAIAGALVVLWVWRGR